MTHIKNLITTCSLCDESDAKQIEIMYEYPICSNCIKKFRLHTDHSLNKYILDMDAQKKENPSNLTFREEMERRLELVEKEYIKKKVKIKYILDRRLSPSLS